MENEALIRVRGKPGTKYEGKVGTAIRTEWLNPVIGPVTTKPRLIAVLWEGEPNKEFVNIDDIEEIE